MFLQKQKKKFFFTRATHYFLKTKRWKKNKSQTKNENIMMFPKNLKKKTQLIFKDCECESEIEEKGGKKKTY